MGLFSPDKTFDEKIEEFQNEGFKREVEIGSAGHGGASRAAATLLFGFVGFAATSGQSKQSKRKILSKREGLEIYP